MKREKAVFLRWGKNQVIRWIASVLAALATLTTVVVGVVGLYQANSLQEENNSLQRAALDSHLEEVMMGVDRHFVSHPELRSYFYSSSSKLPSSTRLRSQALATAELIIDFADDLGAYMRMSRMDADPEERWAKIVRSYFDESAVTRLAWTRFHGPYGETTACVLGAPFGRYRLEQWNWRTNKPLGARPRVCG